MNAAAWPSQTVEAFFCQVAWTGQPLPATTPPTEAPPALTLSQTVEVFFAHLPWQGRLQPTPMAQDPLGLADSVQSFLAGIPWQGVPQVAPPIVLNAKPSPAESGITLDDLSDLF